MPLTRFKLSSIGDGGISTAKLADGAVTTAKLGDSSVNSAKIGVDVIAAEDLAANSVTVAELSDGAVTTAKIADSNITTAKIADSNITTAKIASGAVEGAMVTPSGRRNMIINGAMQVWQRGTSRTYSSTYTTVDRFAPGQFQAAGYERVAVSGTGPSAKYALRVSSSSSAEAGGGTRMSVGQMIEHENCIHTAGQPVTVSFWIKFSAASSPSGYNNFQVRLWEMDSINPSFGSTGPTRNTGENLVSGSLPTDWTKITTTVTTASTAKTLVFRLSFDNLSNTTNNGDFYYDFTEVQVEAGSVATPFEHRSYGEELALCQRYYQQIDLSSFQRFQSVGYADLSSRVYVSPSLPVTMRTSPSGSQENLTVNGQSVTSVGSIQGTSILSFVLNHSGSLSTGGVYQIYPASQNGSISFSAEL